MSSRHIARFRGQVLDDVTLGEQNKFSKSIDLHPPFQGQTIIELKTLVADSDLLPIPQWGLPQQQPPMS